MLFRQASRRKSIPRCPMEGRGRCRRSFWCGSRAGHRSPGRSAGRARSRFRSCARPALRRRPPVGRRLCPAGTPDDVRSQPADPGPWRLIRSRATKSNTRRVATPILLNNPVRLAGCPPALNRPGQACLPGRWVPGQPGRTRQPGWGMAWRTCTAHAANGLVAPCSTGPVARSLVERIGDQDGVIAFGAGGKQCDRGLDQLLDQTDVLHRVGRKVGP